VTTEGMPTQQRRPGPSRRIRYGSLVAFAAGAAGATSGWALLWWGQLDLVRHIARVTGITGAPEVDQNHAVAFGALVAGLALLAWLLASRPGASARRSHVLIGGTLVAWTLAAWLLVPVPVPAWWPGPVEPATFGDQGNLVRSAAPAAYLGPLVVLVVIVAAVRAGSRFGAGILEDEVADPRPPSRMASRVASGLVGAASLVGIVGVAALVLVQWSSGAWEWADLTSLTGRQFVLASAAAAVAWVVSGTARGTAILVLVATVAVLGGDLAAESPYQAGAALLGIATAAVASARRPLAVMLDRLTL